MASVNPGKGLLLNGPVTNSAVTTFNVEPDEYVSGSFHVQTDGTAAVNISVQASNVPGDRSGLGPAYVRNDTATSQDYATLSTATIAAGTGTQNQMFPMPTEPYRSIRLLMTAPTGAPVVRVFFRQTGLAS